MTKFQPEKDILLKQLSYRSNHRGCKETDILLGKFFNEKFTELDLQLYRSFIAEDDALIYDWIMGKKGAKAEYLELIESIRTFHKI